MAENTLAELTLLTAGNPGLLSELLPVIADRHEPASSLDELGAGERLRSVVGRHLNALEPRTAEALSAAAVLGDRFGVAVLSGMNGWLAAELTERLAAAQRAGFVREEADAPGSQAFTHELVRAALLEQMSSADRRGWHLAAATSLERGDAALGDHAEEIAHHRWQALPLGDTDAFVLACERAALATHADGRADRSAQWYARAATLLDESGAGPVRRACVLLALGDAEQRAGRREEAVAAFARATTLARAAGQPELHALAVLGGALSPGGAGYRAACDDELVTALETALELLAERPGALRARVRARLALELYYTPQVQRRAELSRAAVEEAEQAGEPRALAEALHARHWAIIGPDTLDERRGAIGRLLDGALRTGDHEVGFRAHQFALVGKLELGDQAGVDVEIEYLRRLSEQARNPVLAWQLEGHEAMRALLQGRFDEGERRATHALELGAQADPETAANMYAAQLFHHRWAAGRLDELREAVRLYAAQRPWIPAWRCAGAFLEAETGAHATARRALDEVAAEGFVALPRDGNWAPAMFLAAMTAVELGDERHATAIAALLEPYADSCAVLAAGAACLGPIALPLGALTALVDGPQAAEPLFAQASTLCARLDARPLRALCRFEQARGLLRHGPADHGRTRELLEEAAGEARELGMTALAARAAERIVTPARRSAPTTPTTPADGVFVREGEFWRVGIGGELSVVRHLKGLELIAQLLAHPHEEILALTLVTGPGPATRSAAREDDLTAALERRGEPLLDAQARAAYCARVEELRDAIDLADVAGDIDRAERLQAELEALLSELARATGRAERSRRFAGPVERARVNATRLIRSAMRRIADTDRALARHLEITVRTGARCVYAPAEGEQIAWQLRSRASASHDVPQT